MAAKNFDDLLSDERTFVVRGETFTWKDVRPEVLDSILRANANGAGAEGEEKEGEESSMWANQDTLILEFIVPEDHERWKKLRARDEEPITIRQFNAILEHLVSEQTDLPTTPPSPSVTGRGSTAATSKARSR